MNAFSLRPRKRKGFKLSHFIQHVLEVLGRAIKQEEDIKGIKIRKEKVKISIFEDEVILYIKILRYPGKDKTKQ